MLTQRETEILDFVRTYQGTHAVAPSVRIIQRHFKFKSPNAAHEPLKSLGAKGELVRQVDGTWGVKAPPASSLLTLPVFGSIPAGLPDLRTQEDRETVSVDPIFLQLPVARRAHLWALRISGDSMVDAHICDGDIGIFDRREARPGDIIAALVDGTTTTLKRLVSVRGKAVLRAANKRFSDIVPSESLECQGVLVGVLRRVATT